MTYFTIKMYVGYTPIHNGGPSEKWTLYRRVFDVGNFNAFLASLISQHIDIIKTCIYDDIFYHKNVCRLHADF